MEIGQTGTMAEVRHCSVTLGRAQSGLTTSCLGLFLGGGGQDLSKDERGPLIERQNIDTNGKDMRLHQGIRFTDNRSPTSSSPSVLPFAHRAGAMARISHGFASAFLPAGYPQSVSRDYMEYQLWDTAQAFCSYISGTLAHQAVLKGVGVGDTEATAMGATMTSVVHWVVASAAHAGASRWCRLDTLPLGVQWRPVWCPHPVRAPLTSYCDLSRDAWARSYLMRDVTGMVGRIVFAWAKGGDIDNNAKRWRLVADALNDLALLLDLLAPWFPRMFTLFVCASSLTRAVVGVAGGATRAALTMHQARGNNMGDVSAKDGSQVRSGAVPLCRDLSPGPARTCVCACVH